jgi:hypothetical protein
MDRELRDQPDVAVVISSFDRYSDCWVPVAHGLSKYWPDCPYPAYLTTNVKDFEYPGVSVIKTGPDTDWSDQLRRVLSRLDHRYVLLFLEDYWLTHPVDTERIADYAAHMEESQLNYLRLLAAPPPAHEFPGDPRLGLIARDGDYRTSIQIAFWRREVLHDLLVPGESPWQFELNGTVRSRAYGDTFLSVKSHQDDPYYWGMRYLCTAINGGRWGRGAQQYARKEGLKVDFSKLPVETRWHEFLRTRLGWLLRRLKYRLELLVKDPATFWRKLQGRIRRWVGQVGWR